MAAAGDSDPARSAGSRRRCGGERGQALVELALVLPILAVLLFAVIQFGIVFNHYLTLTDAVRAGARPAAVSGRSPEGAARTEDAVRRSGVNLSQSELAVSVSPAAPWLRGAPVTVSATYPYSINLLGMAVKSGRLTSTTTERVE